MKMARDFIVNLFLSACLQPESLPPNKHLANKIRLFYNILKNYNHILA